jgi:hypothetical protein
MSKQALLLFLKALIIGFVLNLGIQYAATVTETRIDVQTLDQTQSVNSSVDR